MGKHKKSTQKSIKEVQWDKPPQDCFKLNTDGAAKGNPKPAACSTVVRDSEGNWIVACSRGLGYATNFLADLNGLRDDLLLAKDRGLLPIIIETDSKAVIHAINNSNNAAAASSFSLIENCRVLL